jgi:white-opaque regulator 2
MSTVSTMTAMVGHHRPEKDSMSEQNASGFTAVNGRDPLSNTSSGRPEVAGKAGNDSMDRRERHVGSQSTSRQHSPRPGKDAPTRDMPNGNQQYSSSPEMETPASTPGKRKRSVTDDGRGSTDSSHYDLSPPRRASGSPAGHVDPRISRTQEADRSQVPYTNGSKGVDSHSNRSHDTHWQTERQPPPGYQTNGAGHHMDTSDAQLAEALQRETHAQNSHRGWGIGGRPEDDDPADQYGAYGADRTSQGAVQAGPKRKRVFSNRTKTGCMTCRKRKKKCDEGHPYCELMPSPMSAFCL